MPGYEMTGTVKLVMDEMSFDSGFTKREFVVTSEDRYPQEIKFECVKEKTALLNDVQPEQRVTVSFDIRGNEYKGRYFVNLSAWRINAADEETPGEAESDAPPLDQLEPPGEDVDNLPF